MKYAGVYSTSQIPAGAIDTSLSHTEQHGGKSVDYWHVFKDNEEPKRKKSASLISFSVAVANFAAPPGNGIETGF